MKKLNKKIKKNIFAVSISFLVLGTIKSDTNYVNAYEILGEEAFARYSKGLVYIGDEEYIENIKNIAFDNDILILDQRDSDDPNMKICDSYKIIDDDVKREILNILLSYENRCPSNWDRTIYSMVNEWKAHNLFCFFNYELDRSKDVDLNNEDEKIYKLKRY